MTSHLVATDRELAWWRPKRIAAAVEVAAVIPVGAIAGSYLFNQMLFTFGPWADLFWEPVALSMLLLFAAVAYLVRDSWLPPAPPARRRRWVWPGRVIGAGLGTAATVSGCYLLALQLTMYAYLLSPEPWLTRLPGESLDILIRSFWALLIALAAAAAAVPVFAARPAR